MIMNINHSNKKYITFKIIKTVNPDLYELYLYNEQNKYSTFLCKYTRYSNIQMGKTPCR